MHYGETEKISIINIAKELNFSFEEIDSLSSRFIDLHILIRKSWILPLKNYGLKTVSNWLGFEWAQKKCKWLESTLLVDSISNYRKPNIFKENYPI